MRESMGEISIQFYIMHTQQNVMGHKLRQPFNWFKLTRTSVNYDTQIWQHPKPRIFFQKCRTKLLGFFLYRAIEFYSDQYLNSHQHSFLTKQSPLIGAM